MFVCVKVQRVLLSRSTVNVKSCHRRRAHNQLMVSCVFSQSFSLSEHNHEIALVALKLVREFVCVLNLNYDKVVGNQRAET